MAGIGVYGSASGPMKEAALAAAAQVGQQIARRGHTLLTGATNGLPHAAVTAARALGARTVGFPAATDPDAFVAAGGNPSLYDDLRFVPASYPLADDVHARRKYRNITCVAAADACVFVAGQIGTLNEFTIAYDLGKPCGVLTGTGGASDLLDALCTSIDKQPRPPLIFDDDPGRLVSRLERHLR